MKSQADLHRDADSPDKLTASIEPEIDWGQLALADILDIPAVQSLLADFQQITGMLGAIVDIKGTGAGQRRLAGYLYPISSLPPGKPGRIASKAIPFWPGLPNRGTFLSYRCKNGMWDMSSPIVVDGHHLGNIYFGQFIYRDEALDREFFRQQAHRYGFDEAAYLAALDRVPHYDRATVERVMSFYAKLGGDAFGLKLWQPPAGAAAGGTTAGSNGT